MSVRRGCGRRVGSPGGVADEDGAAGDVVDEDRLPGGQGARAGGGLGRVDGGEGSQEVLGEAVVRRDAQGACAAVVELQVAGVGQARGQARGDDGRHEGLPVGGGDEVLVEPGRLDLHTLPRAGTPIDQNGSTVGTRYDLGSQQGHRVRSVGSGL